LLLSKAPGLFGEGKWNAPGGKMLPGESPEMGAVREMREETGLSVYDLRFHGILNFYLGTDKNLDQAVFVFSSKLFSGG
jgi:8-oxo-dGTP diphosphatase